MPAKVRSRTNSELSSLLGKPNSILRNSLTLIRDLVKSARFIALMFFAFFQCAGATLLPVIFGVWLKDEYGFNSTQVGYSVLSLSIGELIRFTVSFLLIDYLGCLPTLYLATVFEFLVALVFFLGPNFRFKIRVILIVLQIAGTELAFLCCITWSSKISKYTFVVVTCLLAVFAMGRGMIDVLSPIIWSFVKDNIARSTMSVIMMLIGVLLLLGTISIVIGEIVHKRSNNRYINISQSSFP